MAVLTHPSTTLMDAVEATSVRWHLEHFQSASGVGSGDINVVTMGEPLWRARFSTPPKSRGEATDIAAIIEAMGISRSSFYAWNKLICNPKSDPDGTVLGSSSVLINSVDGGLQQLSLKGLPAGYVLTRGDMLSFDFDSPPRRALHRIVTASIAANGSGVTGLFQVVPNIRAGAASDIAVTLKKPTAELRIIPGSYDPGDIGTIFSGLSFEAIQVI